MSEFVTALNGAESADGIATISEVGVQGMITLRADLAEPPVAKAVKNASGRDMPQAGTAHISGETGVAWMSPDELLILCPHHDVDATLAQITKDLKSIHHLAVNVSAARASFKVEGAQAREVLAKLSPVDMSAQAFGPGSFRRTRMAQVAAAVWYVSDSAFQVICFRSRARYVFDLLSTAAQAGSDVGAIR